MQLKVFFFQATNATKSLMQSLQTMHTQVVHKKVTVARVKPCLRTKNNKRDKTYEKIVFDICILNMNVNFATLVNQNDFVATTTNSVWSALDHSTSSCLPCNNDQYQNHMLLFEVKGENKNKLTRSQAAELVLVVALLAPIKQFRPKFSITA